LTTREQGSNSERGIIKSAIYLVCCLGTITLGVYVFGAWISPVWRDSQRERRIQQRNDYPVIAGACAQLLARLGTNESQSFSGSDTSLPLAIRQLESSWISASTNQVKIAFGMHAHHWGLYYMEVLEPTNRWRSLEFWADGSQGKHLWP